MYFFVVEEILLPEKPTHGGEVNLAVILQPEALLLGEPHSVAEEQFEHG